MNTYEAHALAAAVEGRIVQLLAYRKWHYENRRLIDWPEMRHDDRVELRALVRLARAARKAGKAERDPYPATMTYEAWTNGELVEAFGR